MIRGSPTCRAIGYARGEAPLAILIKNFRREILCGASRGAFLYPRVGCALLTSSTGAPRSSNLSVQTPKRALDDSSGVNLLCTSTQIQFAPDTRRSPHFAGNRSGFYV
jgi:hypothetical protein